MKLAKDSQEYKIVPRMIRSDPKHTQKREENTDSNAAIIIEQPWSKKYM